MIKSIFDGLQAALASVPGMKYTGEDWGQLEYFGERPPVNFPCALYDIGEIEYISRTGGIQDALGTVTISIADMAMRNSSSKAPDKGNHAQMTTLLLNVYRAVQGLKGNLFSKLTRTKTIRRRRDDGIREYVMIFKFSGVDYDGAEEMRAVSPEISIDTKVS